MNPLQRVNNWRPRASAHGSAHTTHCMSLSKARGVDTMPRSADAAPLLVCTDTASSVRAMARSSAGNSWSVSRLTIGSRSTRAQRWSSGTAVRSHESKIGGGLGVERALAASARTRAAMEPRLPERTIASKPRATSRRGRTSWEAKHHTEHSNMRSTRPLRARGYRATAIGNRARISPRNQAFSGSSSRHSRTALAYNRTAAGSITSGHRSTIGKRVHTIDPTASGCARTSTARRASGPTASSSSACILAPRRDATRGSARSIPHSSSVNGIPITSVMRTSEIHPVATHWKSDSAGGQPLNDMPRVRASNGPSSP
eukprot:Amastigsp_a517457_20.p2 type:complete len:315 gc:universal Amastigsp_a517457_20:1668-724(-)